MAVISIRTIATALVGLIEEAENAGLEAAGFHEEAHFQAGLWAWARTLKPSVSPVAEAKFDDSRWEERCDLMLHREGTPAAWIEIKKVWGSKPATNREPRWNTKPMEQLRNFLWDIARLSEQKRRDRCEAFFAACVYTFIPFDEKLDAPAGNVDSRACRAALSNWLRSGEEPDARKRAQAWRHAWGSVQSAFKVPSSVDAAQLLPQMERCMRAIGEVEIRPADTPNSRFRYFAFAGRIR